MAGGMFAGHEESGGELVEGTDGNMYKEFYGEFDLRLAFTPILT